MQNELRFQIALIVSTLSFLGPRVYYRIKTRTLGKDSFPRDNKAILILLLLILIFTFLGMLVWLISPERMMWSSIWLPDWIRWAGVVFSISAAALLTWVHHTLGNSYSAKLEIKLHKLITTGPYRWVRHPMYSAIFLWTISFSLISANWIFFFLPFTFTLYFILRVPNEEKMMVEEYGDSYRIYMSNTGRFLPRLLNKRS